jgi:hypothetical protein
MEDFIANVLELFGMAYFQEFSNTMFDEGMYLLPFWTMLAVPLIATLLYYKVFDGVRGANTGTWFGAGLLGSLVTGIIVFFYVNNKDTKMSLDFAFSDTLAFVIITVIYSLVLYILFSFGVRYLSTNRRLVPFGKLV